MRMITASFVRAIERFTGDLCLHFHPLFQQVVSIRKTCNQLLHICGAKPTVSEESQFNEQVCGAEAKHTLHACEVMR
jgi:hypothetical protein